MEDAQYISDFVERENKKPNRKEDLQLHNLMIQAKIRTVFVT